MFRLILLIIAFLLVSCAPTEPEYQCEFCEGDQACYNYGVGQYIVTLTKDVGEFDESFESYDNTGRRRSDEIEFLFPISECLK